MILWYSIPQSE